MSTTTYQEVAKRVDSERTTRELQDIVTRFMPGFELVEVATVHPDRERDIRRSRAMRPLSGRPWINETSEREFPDRISRYYVRTGAETYRVYVRPAGTDEPSKAVNISTADRCILSLQG